MKAPLTFFTVATPDYFAAAKALFESLKATQEESFEFILFFLSATSEEVSRLLPHLEAKSARDAVGSDWEQLSAMYNTFELCNAIRPYCFRYLLSDTVAGAGIIYLDADIFVLGSFAPLLPYMQSFPLCLTPHILSPFPLDGQLPDDTTLMRLGAYNSGFLAVSNHSGVQEIIKFLIQRSRLYCFNQPPQFFCDQKILEVAVSLFWNRIGHVGLAGFNIAYWNIHERSFSWLEGKYYVNNEPAVFFHFSGFEIARPSELSRWPGRHSCLSSDQGDASGRSEESSRKTYALNRLLVDYVRALGIGGNQQ